MLRYSGSVRCGDRRIDYLPSVDGALFGKGQGSNKRDAQEVAARLTLKNLLSGHEAGNPGPG